MEFTVTEAREEDTPLLEERHKETAWLDLHPEHRRTIGQEAVYAQVARFVEGLKADEGRPQQTFVARDEEERLAGYVWVAETANQITGEKEAQILDIYVEKGYRGRGLGRHLLEAAESWGKGEGYRRLVLVVAMHNFVARRLYEKAGYRTERALMSKGL